jgi:hypothetical protein
MLIESGTDTRFMGGRNIGLYWSIIKKTAHKVNLYRLLSENWLCEKTYFA